MPLIANSQQIRKADQIQIEEWAYPGIVLMEHAGRKAAVSIVDQFPKASMFIILAGPGNNGGDGFVIARYLHNWGKAVTVFHSHPLDKYSGDALINLKILQHLDLPLEPFDLAKVHVLEQQHSSSLVLIDALLGTGIQSALRGTIKEIIDYFIPKKYATVAIDLPSGMNADTGAMINQVIPANITISFQLLKICHCVYPAAGFCGHIQVLDIGLYPKVIASLGIRRYATDATLLTDKQQNRPKNTHKGHFGHALIIGGSKQMAGAISLTAHACMRSGAGLCTVITAEQVRGAVNNLVPEAMCISVEGENSGQLTHGTLAKILPHLENKNVVCIGPGMGTHEETKEWLVNLLPQLTAITVLDADALNLLAQLEENDPLWNQLPECTIITPHPGEMKRLFPEADVVNQRLETAELYARKKNIIVVLKGAGTIIAFPDGNTFVNRSGNPGMSTAGSGDVLAGMITGILAQGYAPEIGIPLAVYLHGAAGDQVAIEQTEEGVTALRMSEAIGKTWRNLRMS